MDIMRACAFRPRAAQGKLCVQQGDRFGGGWQERRAPGDGIEWRRRQQGAAESLVAPESSASAGSDEAQLQRRLVEQLATGRSPGS